MSQLDPLISDLALILVSAGLITIIFKVLKQPVVLGYIVVGFLAGPFFPFFPKIVDEHSIHIWAEIGIIFLLFSLGLEFSFKKLLRLGSTIAVTAIIFIISMMLLGFLTGHLLGWGQMNSIFLAGMVAMSSTTIIIKAVTDLGMSKQKSTQLVFGILIIEDLVAIVLMVAFSSIGQQSGSEDTSAFFVIFKLILFLVLWFLMGIYLLPTFFKKTRTHLNSETLLIVSVGLCLGSVFLAVYSGFSTALGAFIMGSILAETVQAERIEKIFKPVKDLFGAIFFVSVGMMVEPGIIVQYWFPIVILTLVVIFGKVFFGTVGSLVAGQPLKVSMQVGFSLSQIGEFSFIIATLGVSLGLIDSFLYPVAVAVSVITTFTTPYVMKMAVPAYNKLDPHIPEKWKIALFRYSQKANTQTKRTNIWSEYLKKTLQGLALYMLIILGILYLSTQFLLNILDNYLPDMWGRIVTAVIAIVAMAPLLREIALRKIAYESFKSLWKEGDNNRIILIFIILHRFAFAFLFLAIPIHYIFNFSYLYSSLIALPILAVIIFTKKIGLSSLRIERRFKENLNSRQEFTGYERKDLLHDLQLMYYKVAPNSQYVGKTLQESHARKDYGVNIVSIVRGNEYINIPDSGDLIFPYDKIGVIGTNEQLEKFAKTIEQQEEIDGYNKDGNEVILEHFTIKPSSALIGKTIQSSQVRERLNCLVIAIEREDGTFVSDDVTADFRVKDVVWIVGERENLNLLMKV
ncbi:MAG: cation:proton antiporter [Candidatus Azobacteroides sp.]|nr:cation:proton antiporter [Candidatus Azobacteroides sp.]